MAKKYLYRIIINEGKTIKTPYVYDYGNTKNVRLHILKQKAVIEYEMGTKKKIEDLLSFKTKVFRDAFRKIYLIHAIKWDYGLEVEKIRIEIDGESWDYDSATANFPFVFSMIKHRKQNLNRQWKDTIRSMIYTPKTKMDTDLRFCAAFSYIAAQNRDYRIDKFINLWTAMNAYGNYLAVRYEYSLKKEYNAVKSFSNISNSQKDKAKKALLYSQDIKITKVLSLLEKSNLTFPNNNSKWENYYDIQNELSKYSVKEYKELYNEAKKALDDNYVLPEKYRNLEKCAEFFGHPLFIFLLIDYPYHLRCKFLHGSFSTILFSTYNDYEIACLGAVNYFLETYLNEKIPELFSYNYWNDEKYYQVKEAVRLATNESDYNKAIKVFEKLKVNGE